jgi:hypothetical protein
MTPAKETHHDRLLELLVGLPGPELSCEQCFEQLDRYVDLQVAEARPDEQIPGMRAHLKGCPACQEDYESLVAVVGHERPSGR